MIILINGPPGSGKDTAAEYIILKVGNSKVQHLKMSAPMKSSLTRIFNFNTTERKMLEAYKDAPNPECGNMSWREMQIDMFKYLSLTYGPDILGHLWVRQYQGLRKEHTVVSDAGFNNEVIPIIEATKYGEIGIIQLSRPGCNYDNDIREDLHGAGIKYFEAINNQYDLELFHVQIKKVLVKWELLDDTEG